MNLYRNELEELFSKQCPNMAIVFKTIMHFTINIMFNECSAVHVPFNGLQVILACGAAAPMSF